MKGFLYCISRLFEKTGEAAREYMLVHGSAGRINRGGRILVKKNASVEIREGGELVTGKGTVTFQSGCRLVVEKDGQEVLIPSIPDFKASPIRLPTRFRLA